MQALAETSEFLAGDIGIESQYYRIHFRPGVADAGLLDRLLPRLRANFTPQQVLTARGIEQRLYDETWSAPGYDVLARLRDLAAPTLVLHGEDDLIPLELATHVADAIPGARLVVLRHGGHFAHLEAPDAVLRHVRELIA
jgi:pimeloyl-ACP methyl ester carboxylesterase